MGFWPKIRKGVPKIKVDGKARSYLQDVDDRLSNIERSLFRPAPKKHRTLLRRRATEEKPEYYLGRKRGKYGY